MFIVELFKKINYISNYQSVIEITTCIVFLFLGSHSTLCKKILNFREIFILEIAHTIINHFDKVRLIDLIVSWLKKVYFKLIEGLDDNNYHY